MRGVPWRELLGGIDVHGKIKEVGEDSERRVKRRHLGIPALYGPWPDLTWVGGEAEWRVVRSKSDLDRWKRSQR